MSLISAVDDIVVTTLAFIPGLLGRLEYLSGLKGENGYSHWGLTRVHGERAAQEALTDVHESLLSEVLRTPLRKLTEDLQLACACTHRVPSTYVQELYRNYPNLLPDEVGGGSVRHFSSVLHALSALTAVPSPSIHPGA